MQRYVVDNVGDHSPDTSLFSWAVEKSAAMRTILSLSTITASVEALFPVTMASPAFFMMSAPLLNKTSVSRIALSLKSMPSLILFRVWAMTRSTLVAIFSRCAGTVSMALASLFPGAIFTRASVRSSSLRWISLLISAASSNLEGLLFMNASAVRSSISCVLCSIKYMSFLISLTVLAGIKKISFQRWQLMIERQVKTRQVYKKPLSWTSKLSLG